MMRSEEHTSELQSPCNLVCRLLLEKKKKRDMKRQRHGPTRCFDTHRCCLPCAVHALSCRSRLLTLPTVPTPSFCVFFFFFNDTATTEIYTLSLHDALPISYHLEPSQVISWPSTMN